MNDTIGEKLVALRGSRSQTEIVEAVGISNSALSMYESNARIPRDEVKRRISDYYGVSVESIFFAS